MRSIWLICKPWQNCWKHQENILFRLKTTQIFDIKRLNSHRVELRVYCCLLYTSGDRIFNVSNFCQTFQETDDCEKVDIIKIALLPIPAETQTVVDRRTTAFLWPTISLLLLSPGLVSLPGGRYSQEKMRKTGITNFLTATKITYFASRALLSL